MVIIVKQKLKNIFLGSFPLLVGIISSLLTDFDLYSDIVLPELAPPAILFPIVWTILYILMGISFVLVYKCCDNKENRILYALQILLNFVWVMIFFNARMFLLSFIFIIIMDVIALYTILIYIKQNKISGYLLIPYLLWICFASYLNWNIFLLN